MRCNDFDCLRYVDGDYDKKKLARIGQHIAECSACREKTNEFDRIAYMLRSYSLSSRLGCPSNESSLHEKIIAAELKKESQDRIIPLVWY